MKIRYILFLIFLIGILGLANVSAFEFDNIKNTKALGRAGYLNIEIKNAFGLGSKLWEGELTKNTDTCGTSCSAEKTITIYEKGSLIDDVKFETITETDRYEQNIRSYQFYIKTNEEEYSVDDYDWVCIKTGKVSVNGSIEQNCEYKKVGSHIEKKPVWEEYELGQELEAGTYEVKLEGKKKPSRTVDWKIKSKGIWIDDWAVWGSILNNDIMYYFRLNETTGDVIEEINGNNGTNQGATRGVEGIIDNAFYFNNAESDEVDGITDIMNWMDNFTLSYWYKTSGSGDFVAFSTNVQSGTGVKIEDTSTSNDNQWHHFVAVHIGHGADNFTVYVDGVEKASGIYGDYVGCLNSGVFSGKAGIVPRGGCSTGDGDIHLGRISGLPGQFFLGRLDEIGIWNRTLSSSEISDLYNSGSGITYIEYISVKLNSPIDNYISPTNNIEFNCSATAIRGTTLTNMSLWTNESGTWNINQTLTKTGTSNKSIFTTNVDNGQFILWTCQACDSDGDCEFASENRTVSVDTIPPSIIVTPSNYDYHESGTNLTINWTVEDVNLDSCWYNYNETTNITVTCSANTTQFNVTTYDDRDLYFYANDTAGNLNTIFHEWNYNIFVNLQEFNLFSYEMFSSPFSINITYDSSEYSSVSGTLVYDGTSYLGTSIGSGNEKVFSKSIQIPLVSSSQNKTFYWTFAMTNSTGTSDYNSTFYNQTVNPINFSQCGTGTQVVNFSIRDEDTNSLINSDFEASFIYTLTQFSSLNKNVSVDLSGSSSYVFCIDPNATYYSQDIIQISSTGYDTRDYNLAFEVYSNNTPINTNLYLLNSSAGTDVIIETKDAGLSPLRGYTVKIYRYQQSTNSYILIEEDITDAFGQVVASLVQNNAKYKFEFYSPTGSLLKSSGDVVISCRSSVCIQPFVIKEADTTLDRFENITSYEFSLSFNNVTNSFTFSWTDNTGENPIHRLLVTRFLINGTQTICDSESSVLSGSLNCAVGDQSYSYTAQAFRTVDGKETRIDLLEYKVNPSSDTFGLEGLFWSFILLFILIIIGIFSPILGIVLYLIGLVVLGLIGVVYIDPALIIAQIIIGVLFVWAFKG